MSSIVITLCKPGFGKDVEVVCDESGRAEEMRAVLLEKLPDGHSAQSLVVERSAAVIGGSGSISDLDLLHGDVIRVVDEPVASVDDSPMLFPLEGRTDPIRVTSNCFVVGRSVTGRDSVRLDDPTVSSRHARLVREGSDLLVEDLGSSNGTWVNDEEIHELHVLRDGDVVEFGDASRFRVRLPARSAPRHHLARRAGLIEVNRPPRHRVDNPAREIKLSAPGEAPRRRRLPLGTMLVPALMGVLIFIVMKNAFFLLFTAITPVMALWNWVDDRRSGAKDHRRASQDYRQLLGQIRQELADGRLASSKYLRWRTPDQRDLVTAVRSWAPTLWDRRPTDEDFLEIRLGSADLPSLVRLLVADGGDPTLGDEARALAKEFAVDPSVPLAVSIQANAAVGIVGDSRPRRGLARAVVFQVLARHSPADVAVAVVAPESNDAWSCLRWAPHANTAGSLLGCPSIASDHESAAEVLNALLAVAKRRAAQEQEPAWGAKHAWPTIVAVIEPPMRVSRSQVGELLELAANAGIRVVWLTERRDALPGECSAVVDVSRQGPVLGIGSSQTGFDIEPMGDAEFASLVRRLAPLRDASARDVLTSLPSGVGLLELLGLDDIDAELVSEQWSGTEGYAKAPVGFSTGGSVWVDLHSTGDGPHGLVAGTTGAGKSEFLLSLVGALTFRYPPEHLSFLFVDYKGGAAFKECTSLPHCVGLVTNLDQGLADRARRSLEAELVYRQRLFDRHDAKDLDEMRRISPAEAPPALVIVFDEFAALVDEVPDFIDGVIDIAQRGRSLGVHVILATQTPSGVVNKKIQNCTTLRVSLRLKERSESQEVIGSGPDASRLPNVPGRGLLKSGADDVVEFQSAYSGARSHRDAGPMVSAQTVIQRVGKTIEQQESSKTDLERLVAAIRAASAGRPPLRRPWLPELPPVIAADELPADGEVPVIGLLDLPNDQSQPPYVLDLEKSPNLLVIGSGGSGKTTALLAIAEAIARRHPPAELHIYGVDFGNRDLARLCALPQCGGVANGDEPSRLRRLLALLQSSVAERRQERQEGATTESPRVLILVDGLLPLLSTLETFDGGEHYTAFQQLVADGASLKLHFVLATDQPQRVPMTLANAIPERLVLRLPSRDAYQAAGVDERRSSELPAGRAYSVRHRADLQIALPGLASREQITRAEPASSVPTLEQLPAQVDPRRLTDVSVTPGQVPIGLDDVLLAPQIVDFTTTPGLAVVGPDLSGRTTTLRWVHQALSHRCDRLDAYLVGTRRTPALDDSSWTGSAVGLEDAAQLLEKVAGGLDGNTSPDQWTLVAIDDVDDWLESPIGAPADEQQQLKRLGAAMDLLVREARDNHVALVVAGRFQAMLRAQGWPQRLRQWQQALVLGPTSLAISTTDPMFNVSLPRRSDYQPRPGLGVLIRRNRTDLVQVPLV